MTTILQTPTPDLEKSRTFYRKLNFTTLLEDDAVTVTDGQAVIRIEPDRFARPGVLLYDNWKDRLDSLSELTALTTIEGGHLLSDPSGVWIYLMEGEQEDELNLSDAGPSVLGKFAGLSLETTDLVRSEAFWKGLGFFRNMGEPEQGWLSMLNRDNFTVSLMKPLSCPHLFFNPSLTYFNGAGNLNVIRRLRELDVELTEEITVFNDEDVVDNVIIRDPGGYGFFVFSD